MLGRTTPTRVIVSGATDLAAASGNTCALVGGKARCWGSNMFFQVGNNSTSPALSPTMPTGLPAGVLGILLAYDYAAAWTASQVWGWGGNHEGQLGNGTPRGSNTPTQIMSWGAVSALAASGDETCSLTLSGAVQCAGRKSSTEMNLFPKVVPATPSNIVQLSVGGKFYCVLDAAGGVRCWGSNPNGELGDGTYVSRDGIGFVWGG